MASQPRRSRPEQYQVEISKRSTTLETLGGGGGDDDDDVDINRTWENIRHKMKTSVRKGVS
jgi:hypothetical protein